MKIAAKLAVLALAIVPVAALSDNAPRVILAQPGVGDGAIERFTMRFSQPMAPLGDPRAAAPAATQCPVAGQGRWADQQTWVYEFAKPLPGGTTCSFKTVDGLKSVAGYALAGTQSFTVDAGGPVARAVLPSDGGDEIEEDQTFLVAANMAPDPRSVAAHAYCAVDGIGEKIPVDVLAADLPGKLIGAMGKDRWEVRSFLESAGLPGDLAQASPADRQRAMAGVVALKCRRNLPPGRDMALLWGAAITGAGGKIAGTDQRFDYTVRKPFAARFECSRVNAQAGCSPVEKAYVRFSAPVPMSTAQAIRFTLPDGKQIAPAFSADDKKKATIADITFAAPLPFATTAKLELPQGVRDESGRALSNAERSVLPSGIAGLLKSLDPSGQLLGGAHVRE